MLAAGDRVRVGTPGGGGYGDPLARDPSRRCLHDVAMGYYTVEKAAELFGMVIGEDANEGAPLPVHGERMPAGR